MTGFEEESMAVLSKAAEFHWVSTQEGLASITEDGALGRAILTPPKKGQVCAYYAIFPSIRLSLRNHFFFFPTALLRLLYSSILHTPRL
jgi:hypothetical protein